jgi:hypothetical protein
MIAIFAAFTAGCAVGAAAMLVRLATSRELLGSYRKQKEAS